MDMEGRAAEPWSRISWYRWTSFGAAKDPPRAELLGNGSFGRLTRNREPSSREPGNTQMPKVKKHSGLGVLGWLSR